MKATFLVEAIHALTVEGNSTLILQANHPFEVVSMQEYQPISEDRYYGLVIRTGLGDAFTVAEEREVRIDD